MDVILVGTGYVGLTTGVALAWLGHRVTCLDVQRSKIEQLRDGVLPMHEPHLAELMGACDGRLAFDVMGDRLPHRADVVFLTVGTPPNEDGTPDLGQVEAAARRVGASLREGHTVVATKSTVPIGSGSWVASIIREEALRHGATGAFSVASNPEFLREGTAVADTLYPDRIVIGADDTRALETLAALYRPLVEQRFDAPAFCPRPAHMGRVPLVATDPISAELVKYAANAFLALKISFANEIAELSESIGADACEALRALGLDARIGPRFLQAGLGWGGSCFGKDTAALVSTAREYGVRLPTVEAARDVNYRQRDRVIERLLGELKVLKGRTIGLLGLAFKPDTDDLRDAPAIEIARRLIARGARVRVHDPVALERARREFPHETGSACAHAEGVALESDAVILATDWPEYRELDWEGMARAMRTRLVLDGRNFLDRRRLERAGFRYLGVGR